MGALLLSMAILGLTAIDPIGLAIMPILLIQKQGIKKSLLFLFSGFISISVLGLAFSKGLGKIILNFEKDNSWFLPTIETVAAVVLMVIAITTFLQLKSGKAPSKLSKRRVNWLNTKTWKLLLFGVILVVTQSLFDIVFVIAMIRIGQLNISDIQIFIAVLTYAFFALILQLTIVFIYKITPDVGRQALLKKVRRSIDNYTSQFIIAISLVLSGVLFFLAI
jgi:hypothetical protein